MAMHFDGFDDFLQDENLEAGEGIDVEFPNGAKITIHRAGGANKKYAQVLRRLSKPYKWQIDRQSIDEETSSRILREAYAEAVIIGWRGVTHDGEEVPFSKANVILFLQSYPTIFDKIQDVATEAANFKLERLQEDAESLGN